MRYEYIDTRADGQYYTYLTNIVGDTLESNLTQETRNRNRGIWLFGLGLSKKVGDGIEIYGNISQNYRAINFSDMRIDNPSLRIDPNIQDESGFNADLGVRSSGKKYRYDISVYYLGYQDRIGSLLLRDAQSFQQYRFRTNVADSRAYGLEAYGEWVPVQSDNEKNIELSIFANI